MQQVLNWWVNGTPSHHPSPHHPLLPLTAGELCIRVVPDSRTGCYDVQTSEHKLMQPQQHAGKRIHYSRLVVYDIKMFDTEF